MIKRNIIFATVFLLATIILLSSCQSRSETTSSYESEATTSPFFWYSPNPEITPISVIPPTVSTPQYDLSVEDGKAYLALKNPSEQEGADGTIVKAPILYFDTVTELRQKMLAGNFSEEELCELNRFAKDPITGKTIICNLNQLFELHYLGGTSQAKLYGSEYTFSTRSESGGVGIVQFISYDEYSNAIKKTADLFRPKEGYLLTQLEILDDRNAQTVTRECTIEGNDKGFKSKYIVYSMENEYGRYLIRETYLLHHPQNLASANETVPLSIDIYYQNRHGVYAHFDLIFLNTRPSLEALTSFWFEPLSTNTPSNDHVTE